MVDFDAKIDEFHAIVDPIYKAAEDAEEKRKILEKNIKTFSRQLYTSQFYFPRKEDLNYSQNTIGGLCLWLVENPFADKSEYDAKLDEFDLMSQTVYADTADYEMETKCGGGDCESGRCFDNCCN